MFSLYSFSFQCELFFFQGRGYPTRVDLSAIIPDIYFYRKGRRMLDLINLSVIIYRSVFVLNCQEYKSLIFDQRQTFPIQQKKNCLLDNHELDQPCKKTYHIFTYCFIIPVQIPTCIANIEHCCTMQILSIRWNSAIDRYNQKL